ncbi:MAG: tetratricopeptide repeat protein, partial [Candidatus Brocadiae bacterium]|nr:tetratricopeptide repeat protein [Candidatus Brocadiia bacterium]
EPPPAFQAFDAALVELDEVRERIRASSPAGGLLVPDPADLFAVRELLPGDMALLLFEPLGGDAYAAFLLGAEDFRAERVRVASATVAAASVEKVLAGAAPSEALQEAAEALLGPFSGELGAGVQRLYLVCPAELSGLAWQILPFDGTTLAERFEVAFLGGLSDLYWAFEQKSYGRQSVLVCGGWPVGLDRAAALFAEDEPVEYFDVRRRDKSELPDALAYADVLWFVNPVEVRPAAPAAGHLAFPGKLGLLSGVSVGELATYRTRAACAGFGSMAPGAFAQDSFAALRVFTRALTAAGVPSVVYGTAAERAPGGGAEYWRAFLKGVREDAASAAHRRGLGALAPEHRPAFRLYGFAGMNPREHGEFSKLAFSDLAREAGGHLAAGRFQRAAADYMDLRHMAGALEFESETQKARVLAQVQQRLVECFRGLDDFEAAALHQRLLIDYLQTYEAGAGPLTAVAHQSLGALLTQAERFEEAAAAYARSIELVREHGEEGDLARVLGELGKSLDRAADYELALDAFQKALEKYRGLQQPAGVARQHQRIGAIYLKRLSNAPRAEERFREARRLYEGAGEAAEALGATIDLGLCRRALGDFDVALALFAEALAEAEQRE